MNDEFDQLARGVAESVTRRQALKRFAGSMVGMTLASVGFDALGRSCLPVGSPCDADTASAEDHRNCNHCCDGTFVVGKDGKTRCE